LAIVVDNSSSIKALDANKEVEVCNNI
jgi:hypothetical protein